MSYYQRSRQHPSAFQPHRRPLRSAPLAETHRPALTATARTRWSRVVRHAEGARPCGRAAVTGSQQLTGCLRFKLLSDYLSYLKLYFSLN